MHDDEAGLNAEGPSTGTPAKEDLPERLAEIHREGLEDQKRIAAEGAADAQMAYYAALANTVKDTVDAAASLLGTVVAAPAAAILKAGEDAIDAYKADRLTESLPEILGSTAGAIGQALGSKVLEAAGAGEKALAAAAEIVSKPLSGDATAEEHAERTAKVTEAVANASKAAEAQLEFMERHGTVADGVTGFTKGMEAMSAVRKYDVDLQKHFDAANESTELEREANERYIRALDDYSRQQLARISDTPPHTAPYVPPIRQEDPPVRDVPLDRTLIAPDGIPSDQLHTLPLRPTENDVVPPPDRGSSPDHFTPPADEHPAPEPTHLADAVVPEPPVSHDAPGRDDSRGEAMLDQNDDARGDDRYVNRDENDPDDNGGGVMVDRNDDDDNRYVNGVETDREDVPEGETGTDGEEVYDPIPEATGFDQPVPYAPSYEEERFSTLIPPVPDIPNYFYQSLQHMEMPSQPVELGGADPYMNLQLPARFAEQPTDIYQIERELEQNYRPPAMGGDTMLPSQTSEVHRSFEPPPSHEAAPNTLDNEGMWTSGDLAAQFNTPRDLTTFEPYSGGVQAQEGTYDNDYNNPSYEADTVPGSDPDDPEPSEVPGNEGESFPLYDSNTGSGNAVK